MKNVLNKPFIEFLELSIKIQEYQFNNPDLCKAFKLSTKEHFLKAQPIFLDIIQFCNLISEKTLKLFDLELEILQNNNINGIKHIIFKNNIYYFELFNKQNYLISLLKDLSKFKSALNESRNVYTYNEFFLKINLILIDNSDSAKNFSFITPYQLILVYTHYVESLVAPINPVLPLFFHLVKENIINDEEFPFDRYNELFSSYIRDFNLNSNKSFIIREFLTYISKKENKTDISLFKRKNFSFRLKTHFKGSLSFSKVLRSFLLNQFRLFANNDLAFNIHLLGLKYFVVELSSSAIIPSEIPDYVIIVEKFDELTVFVLVCSIDDSKKIKNNFQRINQHRSSRSLGLYLLKDPFSFNIRKSVGEFPAVERNFKFHKAKNYLLKFKHIPNFYENYISNWNAFRGLELAFDESLFQKRFDELSSLRSEFVLNRVPDRIFFTNFPESTPLIIELKYLVIYCKILNLNGKKVTKKRVIDSIIEYSQVWADRLYLWETNDSILLNCLIPFGWNTFVKNINVLMQKWCKTFIFLDKIVEVTDSKELERRYSSQTFLPPLDAFDKYNFKFNLKFPFLKIIKHDFKIK